MLRGIHKASGSWLGKGVLTVIMGLLVISFAIWGIGDIFRGFGLSTVAKVGNTEIGIEQFRRYYNDRVQQVSQRIGRPLTPDQIRAIGLDRQLLGQLLTETTLNEKARALGLGLSDETIARHITSDQNFRGLNGQFDRFRFEQIIRQGGFNEQTYVAEQRNVLLRRQIAQSVGGELKIPLAAIEAVHRFRNEKRAVDYVVLDASQAGDIPAPTPEALRKFLEQRKSQFRAPEYRKIAVLALTPAEQAKWITVSDKDAREFYEQRKNQFGTPERRQVRQIVFPKPEEAQAAAERIKNGLSFADLAKERGLKDSDINLGTVAKTSIIDPAVADAAFTLKQDEVSAPVKGRFGSVLVQVTKIEPGTQKSYEEVAPEIKRTIAEEQARGAIGDLHDKIEDARAGGATLPETAKKLGVTDRIIEAIDRSGRAPDGAAVPDLPKGADLMEAVFASDVGVDNAPLQLPGGGYLWYDVLGVTPSRDRALDEIKDQVESRWKDEEIAALLKKKAEDMVGKLNAGGTLAQVAAESRLPVQKAADLQRGNPKDQISAKVLEAVFRTAKDQAASAEGDKPTERVVFRVTGVSVDKLDPNSKEAKAIADQLRNSYADDLLGEYVGRLETEIGISINQTALNQVIGGGAGN